MYDASPQLAHVPVDAQFVESLLLTGGQDMATPKAVRHILSRFRATLAEELSTRRSLERQLEEMRESRRPATDPIAAAFSALAELDAGQLREVFDVQAHGLLAQVAAANAEAAEARAAAASETNRARVAIATAASAPGLARESAAALEAALAMVPIMRLPSASGAPQVAGGFRTSPAHP